MRRPALVVLLALLLAACGGGDGADEQPPPVPAGSEPPVLTGGSPAAEDPSGRAVRRRGIDEAIAEFQRLGFFAGADPDRLAPRLARRHRRAWGEPLTLTTVYDELALTAFDRRRVWFRDTEGDAISGNDAYVAFLRALARISRGAFAPKRIVERWDGDGARIAFTHRGRRSTVTAADLVDFLDLCVVAQVNAIIGGARRFAVFAPFDQTAYIVALTAGERSTLERRHGWRFARRAELREPAEAGRC